ncbi:MAG: hypothetical protein MUQ25_03780 [Candidatus Aminicenantes bacterium]|nr:hypothetical protein [Candidatus Aminicenantes bacterium]
MSINLKPLITAVVDIGSENYESRVKRIIVFGGIVALVLILFWKRG